jgi:uncharacterized protein (TIGR04255 family)
VTSTTPPPGPFSGLPIEEIPLSQAPLVRVLAQVRFENMAIFKKPNFINPFVETMLSKYPLLEEGHETEISIGPGGVSKTESSNPIWRLRSIDHEWTVTVSAGSLAIETTNYERRTDFVSRFEDVCNAFLNCVGRSVVMRLGVRYTNQITDNAFTIAELSQFFKPEVRGGLSIPIDDATIQHVINDSSFLVESHSVQSRWGILPPRGIFDPTLQPLEHASWFLDIDCSTTASVRMEADVLATEADTLSKRAYGIFRWLVTDELLKSCGAK